MGESNHDNDIQPGSQKDAKKKLREKKPGRSASTDSNAKRAKKEQRKMNKCKHRSKDSKKKQHKKAKGKQPCSSATSTDSLQRVSLGTRKEDEKKQDATISDK